LPATPKLQLRRLSNTEWSMVSKAALRSSEISKVGLYGYMALRLYVTVPITIHILNGIQMCS